jgi:RNA polymerase sigma-70 factor (ECF subfamily)
MKIAYRILGDLQDSEECTSDTFLAAWNTIPPKRPENLKTYLAKLARNLSLNRYKTYTAEKRGAGQVPLALDELQECIPATESTDQIVDDIVLVDLLNRFLASMPAEKRRIFMRRYWYLSPITEIATDFSVSESKVKMSLLRSRNELKLLLEKEGIKL